MKTPINHGATNVTRRAAVEVTRDVDGKTCKIYQADEWAKVAIIAFTGGHAVDVTLANGELETWHHATAALLAPPQVRLDTMPYRRSHGAPPRGQGSWAFTFTKGAPTSDVTNDALWWAPGSLTFTEACRAAKAEARRRFPGVAMVWAEVQP